MDRAAQLVQEKGSTQNAASSLMGISRSQLRHLVGARSKGRDPMTNGRPKLLTAKEEADLLLILHRLKDTESLVKAVVLREVRFTFKFKFSNTI